jgi:hypothetical protein
MIILRFDEFLLEKKKLKKPKKPKMTAYAKEYQKIRRKIGKKWVCLIVTDRTKKEFSTNHPDKPFDIRFGSIRILLNTKGQFEKAKLKYLIGNIYKGETIIDVNFHPYNPLIDNVLFGDQK